MRAEIFDRPRPTSSSFKRTEPAENYDNAEIYNLPISMISVNPFQPRRVFDPLQLADLASSIKQYGLMQPISVRIVDGRYELVAGERRMRASILADIPTIPAMIINITDEESALMAMVENLQRADLNYIEEAEGFAVLLNNHSFTQDELARKVGKNQSTIANKLRLLRLSRNIKKALIENDLSERHARALLRINKEFPVAEIAEKLQLNIIEKITKEGLTVKKTEEIIEKIITQSGKTPKSKKIKSYINDIRIFTNTIKNAIEIINDSGVKATYDIEENPEGCFIKIALNYIK